MKRTAWLLPVLAVTLSAADVSGRWAGVIEISTGGTTMTQAVRAEFHARAHAISGLIGRKGEDQADPIRNGRVDGKRVLFEVNSAETASAFHFDLTMDGDRLEGSMKGAMDTEPVSGKVHLNRDAGK
jgi:hypothetical protein